MIGCLPAIVILCCFLIQMQETQSLIATILDVQPRVAISGGGKSNDDIVYELGDTILAKLLGLFDNLARL